MANLKDIFSRHARYTDSMVQAFETHLREITGRAQAKVIGDLQGKLDITDSVIHQTPGNYRLLRNLNKLYDRAIDEAGYSRLVTAYVGEFPGQLPFLDEVLEYLSQQVEGGLPIINLRKDPVLQSFQLSAAGALEDVVAGVAGAVMQRSMLSVGGLRFGQLVETLARRLEVTVPRAVSLADTSVTMFYRTATDRAFQAIAADEPSTEMRYLYSGPDDKVTRPFCEHLLRVNKSYTREQIDKMENHQIPNVFLACGGWNCRHQWIIDTTIYQTPAKQPAVAARPAA